MPAAREMSDSTCSVEMEEEWKAEDGESMSGDNFKQRKIKKTDVISGWGSPQSKDDVVGQVQMDPDEYRGAHFNYAHFGVCLTS